MSVILLFKAFLVLLSDLEALSVCYETMSVAVGKAKFDLSKSVDR